MSDEQFVDTPPAGAAAWREVWQHDRRYRPGRSWQAWLLRLLRRVAGPDNDRQRDFNLTVLDLVDDLRRQIDDVRSGARADVDSLQHDVRSGDDALSAEIGKTRAVIPVAAMRNDALIAALDQKIETLAVRIRDLTTVQTADSRQRTADLRPQTADFVYRRLEDSLRGSEHEVRESVAHYANLGRDHAPLIDVGCGRGELLTLCPGARGFDTNERSVADLKMRGFDVTLAGVPECFASIGDASIGSVAALHVVEHLPVDLLFAFFRESARVLRDGGLLMIETPNAESLLVSASEFWRDPTHLAPRHPAALVLLAREHGFVIDEARAVHPFPEGTRIAILESDPPELQRVIHAVNDRLFAPQDLRLVARRHR
jgi:SAM-dependent methyltransferase